MKECAAKRPMGNLTIEKVGGRKVIARDGITVNIKSYMRAISPKGTGRYNQLQKIGYIH